MKRVWIVNVGEFGVLKRADGDYADLDALLVGELRKGFPEEEREVAVRVVESVEVALQQIGAGADDDAVIVFTTAGMIHEAKEIKEAHPNLRVALLTGADWVVEHASEQAPGVLVFLKGLSFNARKFREAVLN